MATKTVKNVDPDAWNLLKEDAAEHGVDMGELLSDIIRDHINKEKGAAWEAIEEGKTSLSDKEAEEMKDKTKVFEEEYDFE